MTAESHTGLVATRCSAVSAHTGDVLPTYIKYVSHSIIVLLARIGRAAEDAEGAVAIGEAGVASAEQAAAVRRARQTATMLMHMSCASTV